MAGNTLAKTGFSDVMLVDTERRGVTAILGLRAQVVELKRTRARRNQKDDEMAKPGTVVECKVEVGFAWMWREVEPWERRSMIRQLRWRTQWTLGSIWVSVPRLTGVCGYDEASKQ